MIPGTDGITDVEVRLSDNPVPGPRGETTVARADFAVAGLVWFEDAPVIVSALSGRHFVGIPGGRGRGVAWSPGLARRIAEEVRRAAVQQTGDPHWPQAIVARLRATHPEHQAARVMPPGAATP